MVRDAGVLVVAHQRWQQRTDILSLLPATFGFLSNQNKFRRRDRISLQQSVAVSRARITIRREALVFGMFDILRKDCLKRLRHCHESWRVQSMGCAVVNIDVRHFHPASRILLAWAQQGDWY